MEVLNLNLNEITDIPSSLTKLVNLEELYLSCNQLTNLPENMDALQKLRFLYLDYNKFGSLPPELAQIKGLVILDVSWNNLKYNITNWPYDWNWNWNLELRVLDLSGNVKFELKPNVIRQNDPSLKGLNLTDFGCLTKLRVLDISDVKVLPSPLPTDRFDLRVRSCCYDTEPSVHGVAESIALTWEQTASKVNTSNETSTELNKSSGTIAKRSRFSISAKDVSDLLSKTSAASTAVVMVRTPAYKLSSWDLSIHNFMGHDDEHLWGLFVGLGSQHFAKYLYDSFAFTFGSELKREREDIPNTLRRTFLNLTREYASVHPDEKLGAIGLIAFASKTNLYVANVGDVGAVISRNGTAMVLTSKHICWDREENGRVRSLAGSFDRQGNLQGETHVTRAFGFFHTLPVIAANPTIQKYELKKDNSDEFLILGCGTFWENMPHQTAVDIARTEKTNLSLAAKKLRDLVLSYGVKKSFTVMVVSLHPKLNQGKKTDKDRNSKSRRSNDINDKVKSKSMLEDDESLLTSLGSGSIEQGSCTTDKGSSHCIYRY